MAELEERLKQTWQSSKAGGRSRTARPKLLKEVSRQCGLKAGLENLERREEVLEARVAATEAALEELKSGPERLGSQGLSLALGGGLAWEGGDADQRVSALTTFECV